MKCAVVGEGGELLYTWYGNNNGDVLGTARRIMDDIYDRLPEGCSIGHVTTTGYGEQILIEALRADSGVRSRPSRTCAAPRPSCPTSSSSWTSAART